MNSVPYEPHSTVPRLWWIALILVLTMAGLAAASLWQQRRDALQSQTRELGLLSLALTDELGRGLQGVEEGFGALRAELLDARLPIRGAEATRALRTRADLMPLVRTLWLLGSEGQLLSVSDKTPVPDLASFTPPLNQLGDDAVAVSRPFTDAVTHDSLVALATRFRSVNGSGWVVGAMPAVTMLGAFPVALPAADARMAVFRSDGVRLAASTADVPKLDEAGLAQRLATQQTIELRTFRDGSDHLVALHGLPRYGLKVVLTRNLDVLLGGWYQAAQLTAAALALVVAMMLASMYFVLRAERRRNQAQQALQAQLARSSKLESLGTLAGGVAHDFNNVLAAIVGFGEMAQDAATPGSAQRRHLDKVLQAALRGKALVEHILVFGRGGARLAIVFELEPIVQEVLALLVGSLPPGVVLERRIEAQGARVRGDPTKAYEAVMNLCANAMQAMPSGGMLCVGLERMHVPAARVLSHSQLHKGDYLALTVSDQGTGITAQAMEHLFEPFFSTRGASGGTGLGLAVVHGVVAEFAGAIDVQSTPGQGASFTLYFPQSDDTLKSQAPLQSVVPRGAGQTLLVVDDEPDLLLMTEEMLSGLGYEPVCTSDPTQALRNLSEQPHRYAAVITDEVMPGMTGTDLTRKLRMFSPDLPVLLVSGYGGTALASRAADVGVTTVLAKPLQRADLARALAQLLT